MRHERLEESVLGVPLCRYGASRLLCRGPQRRLDRPYVAFLGGTETFGKYTRTPFPAMVEQEMGRSCVNLGIVNAGPDVYLNDPEVLSICARAEAVVLQVPGAVNLSNRFYRVHARRNDRFVSASSQMRAVFPDVDFTEFHFTRHMLGAVQEAGQAGFALLRTELRAAWTARMKLLLGRIDRPVLLLWLASRRPQERCDGIDLTDDPALVTRRMWREIRAEGTQAVECCVPGCGGQHPQQESNAEVAKRLIPVLGGLI